MASYSPLHHFSEVNFSSSTLFWGRFFFCPLFWGKFFFCTILTVLLFAEHIFSFCEKVLSCWYIWTTKRKLNSGAFQRWIGRERCKNGWRTEIEMEMQTSKIFSQSLQEDFIFFGNLLSTLITFEHVEKCNQWVAYFWGGFALHEGGGHKWPSLCPNYLLRFQSDNWQTYLENELNWTLDNKISYDLRYRNMKGELDRAVYMLELMWISGCILVGDI